MRIFRLLAGIVIIIAAIVQRDLMTGFLGIFLAGSALAGIGCCGASGCSMPANRSKTNK